MRVARMSREDDNVTAVVHVDPWVLVPSRLEGLYLLRQARGFCSKRKRTTSTFQRFSSSELTASRLTNSLALSGLLSACVHLPHDVMWPYVPHTDLPAGTKMAAEPISPLSAALATQISQSMAADSTSASMSRRMRAKLSSFTLR